MKQPMPTIPKSAALAGLAAALSASTSHAKFNCNSPAKDLQDAIDNAVSGDDTRGAIN
jgi:hypothetical protein